MSKISPAPWKTHLVNETVVVSADGEIVAQIEGDYDNDAERMAADARLISLAPEMAEALKYARRFLNSDDHDTAYIDSILAKLEAEG